MKSLKSEIRNKIENRIDSFFDKMTYSLLGVVPKKGKKLYFFSDKPHMTLANLFVQSMRNRPPNDNEKEAARGLIRTANKFITSLKDRTTSNIVDQIDAKIKENHLKNEDTSISDVKNIIKKEMDKAKSHFKMIAETEGTKARNSGALMDISKIGAELGMQDPYCYFVLTRDNKTCKHCLGNHLMPDRITPKVFKLSEIKQSYLTKEERESGSVSCAGQHPFCRCSLVFLSPGFGFKNGKAEWVGLHHNEYTRQKEGI